MDEESYVEKLMSSSVCLITQRCGVGANFLPSKLLPAMATGTPILAVCPSDSPLAVEVNEGKIGVVINPGDLKSLNSTLKRWSKSPRELEYLGANSLIRSLRYSQELILARYELQIRELVNQK